MSEPGLSESDREQLAEQLGYRQIGAELPENVTLGNLIQSLPKDVSHQPLLKANQQSSAHT